MIANYLIPSRAQTEVLFYLYIQNTQLCLYQKSQHHHQQPSNKQRCPTLKMFHKRLTDLCVSPAGGQLGTVIAMPLCGYLATSAAGWPSIFYVFGAITLAWTVLFLIFGSNMPSQSRFISTQERDYIEQSQGRLKNEKVTR